MTGVSTSAETVPNGMALAFSPMARVRSVMGSQRENRL